jgi:hypothetical protein
VSQFTSHLGLRLLEYSTGRALTRSGLVLWHHTEPLVWELGELGSGNVVTVPAFAPGGMTDAELLLLQQGRAVAEGVTDLASIPQAFRWLLAPSGPFTKAACLHDWLYASRGLHGRFTRKRCDQEFRAAMLATGVPADQAATIYNAVRLGGRWG